MAISDRKFQDWMSRANAAAQEFGVEVDDLSDFLWRDHFDDGLTPREAVKIAIEEEGY